MRCGDFIEKLTPRSRAATTEEITPPPLHLFQTPCLFCCLGLRAFLELEALPLYPADGRVNFFVALPRHSLLFRSKGLTVDRSTQGGGVGRQNWKKVFLRGERCTSSFLLPALVHAVSSQSCTRTGNCPPLKKVEPQKRPATSSRYDWSVKPVIHLPFRALSSIPGFAEKPALCCCCIGALQTYRMKCLDASDEITDLSFTPSKPKRTDEQNLVRRVHTYMYTPSNLGRNLPALSPPTMHGTAAHAMHSPLTSSPPADAPSLALLAQSSRSSSAWRASDARVAALRLDALSMSSACWRRISCSRECSSFLSLDVVGRGWSQACLL